MKTLSDNEIRELIYTQTMHETSDDIEWFIRGAIWYRDITNKMNEEYEQGVINGDKRAGL
jgi:hypothetical protein